MDAIRLHLEEKWTYRQINEHLGVHDKDRMNRWMRKYPDQGEFGLVDQRGRRTDYLNQGVSSHISKDSTLMIYEVWLRHKVELKNIFIFTTTEDRNENERS